MTEPEQVLQDYREALRKLYGDEVADKSNLYYIRGWYYISVARKCPDGSYYTDSIADGRRKKQIIETTNNLLNRVFCHPIKAKGDEKWKTKRLSRS